MNRDIHLKPWNEVCLITKYEHHTLINNATVLIENSGDYFYIHDDIEKVKLLEEKEKLPYNYIAIDSDSRLKKLLNNKVLPETIIVDKDGNIILRHQGSF